MSTSLPQLARDLLDGRTFATLSTPNPDGSPQSSLVWVKRDGDAAVFSTIRGRRKTRNMERDPRVSLLCFDPADPYHYAELRGAVVLTELGGRELIDELSVKYTGKPYELDTPDAVRVVCRLTPEHVVAR